MYTLICVMYVILSYYQICIAIKAGGLANIPGSLPLQNDTASLLRNNSYVSKIDNGCSLSETDHSMSIRPMRILIAATEKYLSVLLNWFVFYYNVCHNVKPIYIICLDKHIESRLQIYGLSCSHTHHLPVTQSNNRLWLVRARITKQLLAQGYDVIMSDIDAVWLRNPFLLFTQFPESDVIASRASFPEDIYKRLGATVCMGFLYIRATNSSLELWDQLYVHMSKSPRADDQRSFNQLLLDYRIKYDSRPTFLDSVTANTGVAGIRDHNISKITLTLLPHTQVMRVCNPRQTYITLGSVIAHCTSLTKSATIKLTSVKSYGVWALRDAWDSIHYHGSYDELVQSLAAKSIPQIIGDR